MVCFDAEQIRNYNQIQKLQINTASLLNIKNILDMWLRQSSLDTKCHLCIVTQAGILIKQSTLLFLFNFHSLTNFYSIL